jgi:hypothetical protein
MDHGHTLSRMGEIGDRRDSDEPLLISRRKSALHLVGASLSSFMPRDFDPSIVEPQGEKKPPRR